MHGKRGGRMNNETKQLLEEIKAYRNDMVARNYPFQQISDIITKWENKLIEENERREECLIKLDGESLKCRAVINKGHMKSNKR